MKHFANLAVGVVLAASNASLASATDPVSVYAAGSLRTAFTDIGEAFQRATGTPVAFEFSASGLLRDRILAGAPAQVFASANTEYPRALARAGMSAPPGIFAHNQLCAVTRPEVDTSSEQLLATMLDSAVKLGTSTPKADPSVDYAWELFRKADAIQPGSFDRLSGKALQLTGGPGTTPAPTGGNVYAMLLDSGKADVFSPTAPTRRWCATSCRK